jgi:uncharacterized RDD family membrane protein YckC
MTAMSPLAGNEDSAPKSASNLTPIAEPEYAGFWIRLGAIGVDSAIFLPLNIMDNWSFRHNRTLYIASRVISDFLYILLSVFLVRWRGGTPGKLFSGLRILTTQFKPVGWKEAWLRESIGLAFSITSTILFLSAIARLSEDEFLRLGAHQRAQQLKALGGLPIAIVYWAGIIWVASEFIVLLTNPRRRALHDLVAGTVVIRSEKKSGSVVALVALSALLLLTLFKIWFIQER